VHVVKVQTAVITHIFKMKKEEIILRLNKVTLERSGDFDFVE
jgi:hypothetical protein